MEPMLWSYVLIVIIYICNIVNGAAVTVADCGDPVAEGDPQVLTCHITGSIVGGINWYREGNNNNIINCGKTSKICISSNQTLYSVNSTAHPDNKQQFTINSVSADDFTKKWICIDGANHTDPITTGSNCTLSKLTTSTAASTSTKGGSQSSVFNNGTSDSDPPQPTAVPVEMNVAAISGGIVAAVLVVTIVIVVIIIYKRRKSKDNLGTPSSSKHELELEDNHQSVGRDNPGLNNQKVEILPNHLYESSDTFYNPKPDVVPGKGVQGTKEDGGIFVSGATTVTNQAEPVYGQVNKPTINKNIKKKVDDNNTSKHRKPPPVPPKIGEVQNNNTEDKNTEGATKKKPHTEGINYIDVDFSKQGPTGTIHGEQETTTYTGIAHGKKGKHPPQDSDSDDD